MFKLRNRETKQVFEFTTDELLEELNRDRTEEWDTYTEYSSIREIVEGINNFTEYEMEF